MQRMLVIFALAALSLLASYAIVATWPDVAPNPGSPGATTPPAH